MQKYINHSFFTAAIVIAALFNGCILAKAQIAGNITIITNSKSTFSIVIPATAPSSVQEAAAELQQDISLATGVKLPLIKDDVTTSENYISLGSTKQATSVNIPLNDIPLEGFRILTQNGNVFIIGPDTTDGEHTVEGGFSRGTANGVYTFLHDYLDVRWLMPGELGLDVPPKSTFSVAQINRREAPFFINRRMPYAQGGELIGTWDRRQKMGYSFRIQHQHNWTETVTPAMYKNHPDWFAMKDGQRPEPTGQYKLETTNPEVVQYFADRAIATLKAHPEQNTFSLSPSDGGGWSDSPQSKALYDKTSDGKTSMTPLVLKFYNDVAQEALKKDANIKLAGYIYNDYLYPPSDNNITLPDNFYPVLAGSITYGYRIYRKNVQDDLVKLLSGWSKVTPHLFYYDLPSGFVPYTGSNGTITPAMPGVMNFLFANLAKYHVKGLYIYGTWDWGYGALVNSVMAQMMWNPHLDAYKLQQDWLDHAYGSQAGAVMNDLYLKLDKWFANFYETDPRGSGHFANFLIKGIYADHYPELENLFLKAKSQPMTAKQAKRLQLIEYNLIALQWRLRNLKMLPADYHSPLTRTDEEVTQMMLQPHAEFDTFTGMVKKDSMPPVVK